jgi:plastocyanin
MSPKALLTASFVMLLLVACGPKAPEATAPTPAPTTETTPAPEAAGEATAESDEVATKVEMGGNAGQLKFVPNAITVKPGGKIKWVLNKAGPHNVVFDTVGSPDPASAQAMSQTKLIGKSGDFYITTVPASAKPGKYPFHCTPHKGAGMVGVLTVAP